MTDVHQRHAIDVQLLAIRCGALYGALAFAGLIAAHLVAGAPLGALLAILGAAAAYANFTLIAASVRGPWIDLAMIAAIAAGIASGFLLLARAL